MAINFPNSPTNGQTVVLANKTLVWSSATGTWNVQSSASSGGGSLSISDTVPSSPSDGDMWFNSTSLNLYAYYDDGDSQQWIELSSNDAQMGATVSDTAPSSPANGDFWFDSSTLTWYTYYDDGDSQQWLDLAGQATTVQVTASDTAPTSPSTGQLWFDTANLNLFVYYSDGSSNQWVQMNSEATAVPTDVSDLTDTTGLLGGGVTAYANLAAFPSTGNTEGDFAFAQDTKALYIWNGTEWKRISIGVDETPFVTTEPATSHDLNTNGSTSTVTMVAYDPEGFDISYGISYNTTNNARPSQLSADTTINQTTGVYTFTPSISNFGSFKARLSASDGARMTTRTVDVRLLREVTFAQSTGFFTADSTNGGTYSYTGVTSNSSSGGGGVSNVLDVRDATQTSSFYLEVEFQDISTGDDPAIWIYPSNLGTSRGYEIGYSASLLSNGNDGNGSSTGLGGISNGDRVMLMWTNTYFWLGKNGTWSSITGNPNGSHQNGSYAWTNMATTGGPYIAFGSHSSTASNYTFTIHGNGSTNYTTGFGTGGTHTTVVY